MKKLDFNRGWTVRKDGSDIVKEVNLPHDAMIYEERRKDSPATGACGYFTTGKYFYKKLFTASPDWEDGQVILELEGVYQNASVALNGQELAVRPYGYSNFFVDLTGILKFDSENELVVTADNADAPNSRWYSGSGIYRPVWLYTGPQFSIAPEGIHVEILDRDRIRVSTKVLSPEDLPESAAPDCRIEIFDGEQLVAEGKGNPAEITIPEAIAWSERNPHLYRCVVTLDSSAAATSSESGFAASAPDTAEVSFGLRTVSCDGSGLRVNGEEVLLRGACIHHDNGILGAACFADAEERRVRILKESGFNAIRSAHNPMSKSMLDACDRLGVYVMDETFDMWLIHKNPYDYGNEKFSDWWMADTAAMVEKDFNHPSVILYSLGNEISDLGMEKGQDILKEMAEYARSLDSSRPLTLGINLMLASLVAKGKGMYGNGEEGEETKKTGAETIDSAPTSSFFNMMMNRMGDAMELASATPGADKVVSAIGDYLDMPGYNYAAARYKKEAKKYPGRPFVGSETLPKSLYRNWQLVKKLPELTGDFMWTGWDYLGESGIGTIRYMDKKTKEPVEPGLIVSGGAGVIDLCGYPRAEVGWNKSIWGLKRIPTIGVDPVTHAGDFRASSMWRNTDAIESWSWTGCEGTKTDVVVYSDAAYVSLAVNGKSYGKKRVHEHAAHFHGVRYEAGSIAATAYDRRGRMISRSRLKTAEGRTSICLAPEKTELKANGQDLCYLNLSLVGENGIIKSSEDQKLTVTVEGPGTLQGFGSARPCMSEDFVSNSHTTYYGRALAVVRAGYEAGTIRVTVSGDGLETQVLELNVE